MRWCDKASTATAVCPRITAAQIRIVQVLQQDQLELAGACGLAVARARAPRAVAATDTRDTQPATPDARACSLAVAGTQSAHSTQLHQVARRWPPGPRGTTRHGHGATVLRSVA